MLAAGLLAKKAVERGLSVKPWVKTSLAPGSRVVSEYLNKTGLQPFLDRLGLQPRRLRLHDLHRQLGAARSRARGGAHEERHHRRQRAVGEPQLRGAHSPEREGELPHEPAAGRGVRHRRPDRHRSHARAARRASTGATSICATSGRRCRRSTRCSAARSIPTSTGASMPTSPTRTRCGTRFPSRTGQLYEWDPGVALHPRAAVLRSVDGGAPRRPTSPARGRSPSSAIRSRRTTSARPARSSRPHRPATTCASAASPVEDFNSYGARRGNHEVMVRGTFANVRIRNLMVPGVEGGVTRHQPDGERMGIYDAAERYRAEGVPLVVIAGQDYGAGSSRDWAAKGTRLLGVRAVIARGFERIHRSNLIGMGVLPCQFPEGVSAQTLGLDGTERFDLELDADLCAPRAGDPARRTPRRPPRLGAAPAPHRYPDRGRLLLGRRNPARTCSSNCSPARLSGRQPSRHDQDQAHVRASRARRRPANPGGAPVAAGNEEGGARGGRLDEGGRTHARSCASGSATRWSDGRSFAGGTGRSWTANRIRLEAHPRAGEHGTVTLLYSAHDTLHNGAIVLRDYLANGRLHSSGIESRGDETCATRLKDGEDQDLFGDRTHPWQRSKTGSLTLTRAARTARMAAHELSSSPGANSGCSSVCSLLPSPERRSHRR